MRTRVDKATPERINLALSELDRELRAALANGDIGAYTVLDNAFIVQHYLDTSREAVFSLAGLTAATRRTYTLPDADTTVVGTTNTQTLTNKTIALASNTVSGNTAAFNAALTDNDFATLAGPETLTNKTLTTPTIGDFSNATHNHSNAAGGGTLSAAAIGSGTLALARGGTNADLSATGGASNVLQQASAGAAITVGQLAASNLSNGTTGSNAVVLDTSPILVTPVLGVATATSINKVALTAPATSATLTVADGKTLTASNSLTLAGTDGTTQTFQASDTIVGRATTDTLTNKTLTAPSITSANITDSAFSLNGARLQMFAIEITNTAGTLQHRIIGELVTPTASPLADKVTGASATYANTPNVAAGVDFVSGCGIDNTNTSRLVLNTAAQTDSKFMSFAWVVERNSTATAGVAVSPRNISLNVNGVTRNRFAIGFVTAAGVAFNLTTGNIGASAVLRVRGAVFLD